MTSESKRISQGAGAGVIAALVMGLAWMIVSAARGAGFFTPVELIGATFLRGRWMEEDVASAILGTALHVFTGAALGALFAFLTRDLRDTGSRLAAGVAYGAGVFLAMTFLILPWASPVLFYSTDKGLSFLLHLVFGATLPIAMLRRRVRVEPPVIQPPRYA